MATEYTTALLVEWQNDISPETLSADKRQAYDAMREHNRLASEARARFERLVQQELPDNCHAVFNYRFGKLSMAVAAGRKDAADKKPQTNGKSLQSFLDAAKAAGRNS